MRSLSISTDDKLKEDLYLPAEDTCLLLKVAEKEVKSTDSILEIGCGRGIISKRLQPLAARVLATDINPSATKMARIAGIESIRADLFRGINARFDLIIFNPPYLPTTDEERLDGWLNHAFDGGVTGRDTIFRFLEDLSDHLTKDGRALLLVSSLCGLDEVRKKVKDAGLIYEEVAVESHFFEKLVVLNLKIQSSQEVESQSEPSSVQRPPSLNLISF